MNSEVLPVTFCNKAGNRLFGMLHRPMSPHASGAAIILLSPGVKMRVAPHRLYINMSERFVELGYPVLRFDFYGLGDSEGEAQEEYLADLYGAIQVGRYVEDTIAAMDWLQRTYGMSQFIVSGLCGGAITGLLTAARDTRITCLLGLAIPVILDGSQIDYTKYMTDAQLKGMRDGAIRKLWDFRGWRSWVRFLTFQSNYRLMARSFLKPLIARLQPEKPAAPVAPQSPGDNTNPYFARAFFSMQSTSRQIYLVFAGMDRLLFEFEKKFVERNRAELERYASWHEIHVTKDANHIFSFRDWEEDMLDQCSRWLRRFGSVPGEGSPSPQQEISDELSRRSA
jgi:alpha/beta superfamily hydrolase